MFNQLTAKDSRENKMCEGFGVEMDYAEVRKVTETVTGATVSPPVLYAPSPATVAYAGIQGTEAQSALFKPLSGLFNQGKYIPLKFCGPIIIELEVVNDKWEAIIRPNTTSGVTHPQYFIAANTSDTWQLENVQVKCDVCTLDNQVENIFTKHMLDGGSFPLRYDNYISQSQPVSSPSIMVNVTRTASRLKSCFVTLNNTKGANMANDPFLPHRPWCHFWSPMSGLEVNDYFQYDADLEFDNFYIQIGSKIYPEYSVRSHSEAYYQLTKCLGIQASDIHNLDINAVQYHQHKFIMGIDLEKVLEARGTGYNTKAGDLLTVFFKHKATAAPDIATDIATVLVSENILSLSNVGVEVFD